MTIENGDRSGYWSIPTIKQLRSLTYEQLCNVTDFRAGRHHVGSIQFTQSVDLSQIPLDSLLGGLIIFETGSCTVYPVESNTPPMGQGLNVPATIELCNLQTRAPAVPLQRLVEKLQSVKYTRFMDYNTVLGRWRFSVQHFTRYEFPSIDDEDETMLDVVESAVEKIIESPSIIAATATAAIAILDHLDNSKKEDAKVDDVDDVNMAADPEQDAMPTGTKRSLHDMSASLAADEIDLPMNDVHQDTSVFQVSLWRPHWIDSAYNDSHPDRRVHRLKIIPNLMRNLSHALTNTSGSDTQSQWRTSTVTC
jgi:hypothetical protein